MSYRFTSWAVAVLALLVLLLGAGLAGAQRGKGGAGNERKTPAKTTKSETFAVVKVGEAYEVVPTSELNAFKKKISERHREELKAHAAAKKAAAKSKEPFNEPKPKAPRVSVVKKGIKTESEARTVAQRLAERQRNKAGGAEKDKSASPKGGDGWVVVEVDGTPQVMSKSDLAEAKKKADAAYRDAMKEWTEAKKEAAKNKSAFDRPRPQKSDIKPVGKTFKTEDAAREYCDKLRAKSSKPASGDESGS